MMDPEPAYQFAESTSPNDADRSWAEKNGFSDWGLAVIWIVVAFIAFQMAAGIVAMVLFLMREGVLNNPDPQQIMNSFYQNLDLLFIGNSFGQIVFLGLATWFFSRLHTTGGRHRHFMRFKMHDDTPSMLVISAILIVVAQPVIWFLSWINLQIPVPEVFTEMQHTQLQMIEEFLRGDHNMLLTLFHIGLVPAVCEEVLYRSYVLRAFQRSWGITIAIVASGLFFGMYHLQLANLLPLAAIGMLLAYITYISDSIYPAMIAHLVNNGGSVLVASYYPDSSVAQMTPETMPPVWALILGLALSSWLVYYMYQKMTQIRGGGSDV